LIIEQKKIAILAKSDAKEANLFVLNRFVNCYLNKSKPVQCPMKVPVCAFFT